MLYSRKKEQQVVFYLNANGIYLFNTAEDSFVSVINIHEYFMFYISLQEVEVYVQRFIHSRQLVALV